MTRPRKACSCGCGAPVSARGLARRCYSAMDRRNRLAEFPRAYRTADEVLDAWEKLAMHPPIGTRREEIAGWIGVSHDALAQVLVRARRRNDPRAIYLPRERDRYGRLGPPYQSTPRESR